MISYNRLIACNEIIKSCIINKGNAKGRYLEYMFKHCLIDDKKLKIKYSKSVRSLKDVIKDSIINIIIEFEDKLYKDHLKSFQAASDKESELNKNIKNQKSLNHEQPKLDSNNNSPNKDLNKTILKLPLKKNKDEKYIDYKEPLVNMYSLPNALAGQKREKRIRRPMSLKNLDEVISSAKGFKGIKILPPIILGNHEKTQIGRAHV